MPSPWHDSKACRTLARNALVTEYRQRTAATHATAALQRDSVTGYY